MKKLLLFDKKSAAAAGYRALTIGYHLPQEQPMLYMVLADLRRGNINHCLVETHDGVAVWRLRGAAVAGRSGGKKYRRNNATCRVGQKRRHISTLQIRAARRIVATLKNHETLRS
jgi:hypothetical protein